MNQARLDLLARSPGARIKPKGVLSVDDTLLTHGGQAFEQIAKLFDPVPQTYVWAHDLVTLPSSDDDTDYPVLFQLWKPVDLETLEQGLRAAGLPLKAGKEALKESAPSKWRGSLLGVWQRQQKRHPEIRALYDRHWFTQPAFCRFLDQTLHLPYVGTLAESDKVNLKTGPTTLANFAAQLKQEHLDAVPQGGKPIFQRITISYQGTGIRRIRRHRWPVEVYHEEGKAEGLAKYQLRDFGGIERHVALVAVVYS